MKDKAYRATPIGGRWDAFYGRSGGGPPPRTRCSHQEVIVKRALELAGLPETIKMHELRHSAADNLWRETGNIVHAKQLLRHRSVGTTEAYLHPSCIRRWTISRLRCGAWGKAEMK